MEIDRRATTVAALLLVGCSVGPGYRVPPAPTPVASAYKETLGSVGTWKLASPSDAIPRGAWWTMFHEPELDALEARLNINNQTIVQAVENYLAARAQIREARSKYFPTAAADPSVVALRSSGVTGAASTTQAGSSIAGRHNVFVAPLDASWAPDLFGRVKNSVRQSQAAAQVSAADLESTRLLAQATLAQTYFRIRGQDALQDVLDQTVVTDQTIVDLTRSRDVGGLDSEAALVEAELTLENARVQATNAAILRAQLEHAIATLLGVPATTFTMPRRAALATPPAIPTGAPSALLEHRPDIAGAERQMASANAALGIGYAAYFPVITLTGEAGFASTALESLFSWPSRVWSIGATLSETLLDAGLRRATIDQSIAVYNATVAAYRQTVLVAFQQVEDGLAELRVLTLELEQQRVAVALAQRAFDLERQRFEKGLDPYTALMLQQTALLASQQTLVTVSVEQMSSATVLVRALGGGWSRADLPTPDQVTEPAPAAAREIRP